MVSPFKRSTAICHARAGLAVGQNVREPYQLFIRFIGAIVCFVPLGFFLFPIFELKFFRELVLPHRSAVVVAEREFLADQHIGEGHIVARPSPEALLSPPPKALVLFRAA